LSIAPSFLKFLFPIIVTVFIYSCAQQKDLPQSKIGKNTRIKFVAWNEDTLNSYHIVAFSNNTFYYGIRIVDSSGKESQTAYIGRIKYDKDGVYLRFKGKDNHNDLAPYLVAEVSGDYLIQYFNSSSKRYFLRFLRSPRHLY